MRRTWSMVSMPRLDPVPRGDPQERERADERALGGHAEPTACPRQARVIPDDGARLVEAVEAAGEPLGVAGDRVRGALLRREGHRLGERADEVEQVALGVVRE